MPQDTPPLPPLGIAGLIGQSFRLLASHFGTLFPLAFVPALVLAVLGWLSTPVPPPVADPAVDPMAAVSTGSVLIGLLASLIGFFIMGFMCLAALDAILGKRHTIGEYAAQTMRNIVPIIGLGLLLAIAFGIGALFLIVPALYIAARYLPWVPAVVFENAGWSGLSRAGELTRGYRWPLVGAVLLMGIVVVAALLVLSPLAGVLGYGLLGVLLEAIVTGLYYALISIFTALVYARLREIKEGLSIPQIAALID